MLSKSEINAIIEKYYSETLSLVNEGKLTEDEGQELILKFISAINENYDRQRACAKFSKYKLAYLNKRLRKSNDVMDNDVIYYDDPNVNIYYTEDDQIIYKTLESYLKVVLNTLYYKERLILYYYYIEGLSLNDISAILNLAKGYVSPLRDRALRKLRHPSRSIFIRDYDEDNGCIKIDHYCEWMIYEKIKPDKFTITQFNKCEENIRRRTGNNRKSTNIIPQHKHIDLNAETIMSYFDYKYKIIYNNDLLKIYDNSESRISDIGEDKEYVMELINSIIKLIEVTKKKYDIIKKDVYVPKDNSVFLSSYDKLGDVDVDMGISYPNHTIRNFMLSYCGWARLKIEYSKIFSDDMDYHYIILLMILDILSEVYGLKFKPITIRK